MAQIILSDIDELFPGLNTHLEVETDLDIASLVDLRPATTAEKPTTNPSLALPEQTSHTSSTLISAVQLKMMEKAYALLMDDTANKERQIKDLNEQLQVAITARDQATSEVKRLHKENGQPEIDKLRTDLENLRQIYGHTYDCAHALATALVAERCAHLQTRNELQRLRHLSEERAVYATKQIELLMSRVAYLENDLRQMRTIPQRDLQWRHHSDGTIAMLPMNYYIQTSPYVVHDVPSACGSVAVAAPGSNTR